VIFGQIVIGTSVAPFFSNFRLKEGLPSILAGVGLTAVRLIIAALFALAFHAWPDVPFSPGLLDLVPGGLPVMSLASLALGLDPAFVSFHHLFRVVLVLVFLPMLVRLWIPKSDGRTHAARQEDSKPLATHESASR